MARISLRSNTKFLRVCRDLKRPPYQVRGLLEMMWESAYENGVTFKTLDDAEVVSTWDGDIGAFGKAILDAGLLDEVEGGYQIHDYAEHAPYWWKERERERNFPEGSRKFPESARNLPEGSRNIPGKRASSVEKSRVEKRREEYIPPVGGDTCPLSEFPAIKAAYPKIRNAILKAHPKAKIPELCSRREIDDRLTLNQLVRLDGFAEQEVLETLHWVLKEEPDHGGFTWRQQFQSIAGLRKVTSGMSKFARMNEAMKRAKAGPKGKSDDEIYQEMLEAHRTGDL